MKPQNFSDKMNDPIFKKHFIASLIYLALTLLILSAGVVFVNDQTDQVLQVTQKEKREKEAKDKLFLTKAEDQKKVQDLIAKVKPDLKITTTQESTGETVEAGDSVLVHYTGKLEDGTKFDSSLDRGQPFQLDNIGSSQVIPGWNAGIIGMKKGGKYSLFIPAVHAYGDQQRGEIIKPNSNLVFDLEIVNVDKSKNLLK
jgi:peptidylprolyl isomerase